MLLTEALERFERDCGEDLAASTLHNYRSAVRSLVEDGVTTTRELVRARVAEWLARRQARSLSVTTINAQFAGVLSVLSHLEKVGLFPLSRLLTLRRLRLRSSAPPTPAFLTREQLVRLRAVALAIDHDLDLAISLAVFAGLRLGEIQRLERKDLELELDAPYVRVVKDGHGRGRGRTAPIARSFAAELLSRGLAAAGPLFPRRFEPWRQGLLGLETLQSWLREARDAAELYHVTWFVLRHCFASWLRQGGVELGKISGWMGNTVRICELHYAALAPGGDMDVERMNVR